jgi:hypothetical protein
VSGLCTEIIIEQVLAVYNTIIQKPQEYTMATYLTTNTTTQHKERKRSKKKEKACFLAI